MLRNSVEEREIQLLKEVRNELLKIDYLEVVSEADMMMHHGYGESKIDLLDRGGNFRLYYDKYRRGFKLETTWSNQAVTPIWMTILQEMWDILSEHEYLL